MLKSATAIHAAFDDEGCVDQGVTRWNELR